MAHIAQWRRTLALTAALAVAAVFVVIPSQVAHAATATLLTSESFTGSSVSDPNWTTGGTAFAACLTASTATTQTPVPGCANGAVDLPSGGDAVGSGALRLTENVGNQVGYALYNVPLPFTKGLVVTFDQYQYAGNGADGIGFFLADGASSTFTPGQPGGSFGYAQRDGLPGTPNGYMGLGLDAYGNFARDTENRGTGCTAAQGQSPYNAALKPDTVTLRGPGNGTNDYCWLATSSTLSPSLRTSATTRTAASTKQGFRITIDPSSNTITVERNMYDGNGYSTILTTPMPPSPPTTVKFGFLASTGGSNDIHEINNVSITSLQQLAALKTSITPSASSFVTGTTGTYTVGVSSDSTQGAGNTPVVMTSTLPTGVTMNGTPSGTGWDCSASSGQNVSCTRSGFYTAGTVFPNISIPVTYGTSLSSSSLAVSDTVYASDAAPAYATSHVAVTPLAVNDTYTAVGGAATTMAVLSNDKGTLDPTTVSVTSPSPYGTTSVNPTTGVVTFTSTPGYSGSTSFTYQVKDTSGQATTAVATVTITPKAYADAVSTPVNTAVTSNPLSNDYGSFDTTSLSISTAPSHGTAVVQSGGLIKYTPNANYSGTDTLTYKVKDTGGTSTTAVVTYTVAPTAANDTATTAVNTATSISVLSNDVGSLTPSTVTVTTAPAHGTTSVNTTTGAITYTPTTNWSGVDTFTYQVSDGTTPVTATVTVTVTPTAASDTATTNAGTAVSIPVLSNDHGAITPSSVNVSTAPAHGSTSVNTTTGAITYTPSAGWSGTDTFVYSATDGAGQPISATVTVTVDPTAAADSVSRSVTASGPITLTPLSNDVGSLDPTSFTLTGTSVFGSTSWNSSTGTLTVVQPGGATASGTWTQGYKICDTSGTCATSTITVTVTPQANPDSASTAYGSPVSIPVLTNDQGSVVPSTVTVTSAPSHGSTSVNTTTGAITYTRTTAGWSGVDSFVYRVSDGTTTTSATVTVTVTPTAVADTASVTGDVGVSVPVLSNDLGSVVPGTVSVTTPPALGSTSVNATTGAITYTPPANYSGTQTFTYSVQDGNGSSTSAVVTVTVNPVAAADSATTPAGTPVTVNVLANDSASPKISTETATGFSHGTATVNGTTGAVTYTPAVGWSGTDTGTVAYKDTSGASASSQLVITTTPVAVNDTASTSVHTAVSVPVLSNDLGNLKASTVTVPSTGAGAPAHGATTVNTTTGAVTYTPVAGFSGTDAFTYTVADVAGQTTSATVAVTVSPTLANDTASTNASTPIDIDVLANDQGSLNSSTLATSATSAHGATLSVVAGKIHYVPSGTYSGPDSFSYSVSDTSSQSATATVAVTVTPIANDDTLSTTVGAPDVATPVLANDYGYLDPSTVTVTTAPAHGTTSVNTTTGAITVHPTAGWSGKDSLTYRVCDHSSQCTTAVLHITVAPVSGPVTNTTQVNVPVTIDPTTGQSGSFDVTTTHVQTAPLHGTTSVDPTTGMITYTPATNFSGTDSFTYTIADHDGQTITVTVTVGVIPTAADDAASTPVNVTVDVPELANDHGAFTGVTVTAAPSNGTATVQSDLSIDYVPNPGFSGVDTFTYTAKDAANHTVPATVVVHVTPTGGNDAGTSTGHQPVTVDVLANDHGSLSPSTVTVTAAPAHGTTSVDPSTGKITYTPAASWSGTDTFSYSACDAASQCVTPTVTIVTTPDASPDSATTFANQAVVVDVLANDHGSFDPSTVAVTTTAGHGTTSVDPTTGKVTYTPSTDWSGNDSFAYTAHDLEGRAATATVSIGVTPVVNDDNASTLADTPVAVPVLANDLGAFDPSTVSVQAGPLHGSTSVDPTTGAITYTPSPNWSGDDSFSYTVCDTASTCGAATVSVHVDPRAIDDLGTTAANQPVSVDVLANDRGALDPSSVSVQTAPAHGSTSVNSMTGAITYTPAANWSGNDVLGYRVCDTDGSCVSASVTLHVTPTAANDVGATTANHAVSVDVLANDAGSLDPSTVTVASGAAHGSTSVDPVTGAVTYTPAPDWSGDDSFTYVVTDGASRTTGATVHVVVAPTAGDDSATTTADHAVSVPVLTNDHGAFDPSTVTVSSAPAHGMTAVDATTGAITYTPAANWSGDDTLGYTVCDTAASCVSATVTLHVTPTATADSATTTANHSVDVTVLANDAGSLDPTSVTVSTPAAHGTTSVDPATGAITYTPAHDWSGTDSFVYAATDGASRQASAEVDVTVSPTATDDTASTVADAAVDVPVLANDHGSFVLSSLAVSTAPTHGSTTVDASTGVVTYTPDAGWSGQDAFSYTVCDATPDCATATVDVHVTPTVVDDSASTTVGTPTVVNVLGNDDGALDPSTVTVTAPAANGTTTVDPTTGAITYTPAANWSGDDSFTYRVCDAVPSCGSGTVSVHVAPTAADDSGSTTADHAVTVDVLANDHGTLDPSTVTVTADASHGSTSVDPLTGAITYTPAGGWSGDDSVDYRVCDTSSSCVSATVALTVTPTAANDSGTTTADHAVTVDVLSNDDGTLDPSTVSVTTQPGNGSTTVDPLTGAITYTPAAGWSGSDSFGYSVTDGASRTVSATVSLLVTPVASADSTTTTTDQQTTVDVLSKDDGAFDPSSVTVETGASHGSTTVDPSTGEITYTPTSGWSGNDSFTYTACDAVPTCVTATVSVLVVPTATDDAATTTTDQGIAISVLADDQGSFDPSTVTVTTSPLHGTTSVDPSTGVITYTPDDDWSGDDVLLYEVCDHAGSCVGASVALHVDPTASDDTAAVATNHAAIVDVLANDHGTLDPSTVTVSTPPSHGSTSVDPTTGAITYTPTTDWSGTDTFVYQVTDGANRTVAATVSIDVGPVAHDDTLSTVVDVPSSVNVLANDHGAFLPASVTVSTPPSHGSTSVDPTTGAITYTPAAGWSGDDTFTYRACDGDSNCRTAAVAVQVVPTAAPDTLTTAADQAATVDVLANDHGALDPSTETVTSAPVHGTTSVNPTTGAITFTPEDGWSGHDTFTYSVCDAAPTCVNAVVTVRVTPTATDDSGSMSLGDGTTSIVVPLLVNDVGTFGHGAATILTEPGHGTATIDPTTHDLTYVPATGFMGTDSLSYTVCDTAGDCTSASVELDVRGIQVLTSSACVRNAPYVSYAVRAVGFTPASSSDVDIAWVKAGDATVATENGLAMSGRLLWPGAKVNAKGVATAWPGWAEGSGGQWHKVDDGLRSGMTLRVHVDPTTTVAVSYPKTTAACETAPMATSTGDSAAPTGSHPGSADPTSGSLAKTGADVIAALDAALAMLVLGGLFVLVTRRRRRTV